MADSRRGAHCVTRSNCCFWAWGQFVRKGGYLRIRRTRLSRLRRYTARSWWRPVRILGIVLQWTAVLIHLLGWSLRWGGWFHTNNPTATSPFKV